MDPKITNHNNAGHKQAASNASNANTGDEIISEMDSLAEKLRTLQYEYYVLNSPSRSDQEYDALFDRLKELEGKYPQLQKPDSPAKRVGSDLTQVFPEVEHTIPVLSLDKAYTPAEVLSWCKKSAERAGGPLGFVVEEKIDGSSIILYYEKGLFVRGVTRGNGLVGNDITENVKTIGSVPLRLTQDLDIAVRGEIYLPIADFEQLNEHMETPYANPRNFAAGTLRRVKSSEVARVPLHLFVYEGFLDTHSLQEVLPAETHVEMLKLLSKLGFRLNPRVGIFSDLDDKPTHTNNEESLHYSEWKRGKIDGIPAYLETMAEARKTREYELDGLVLKVNELRARDVLGYTGHHPRWALAYKFESPGGISRVLDVDVQVGRTGRITPVARVGPVLIGGSTISNVTLHNQEYVNILELSVGDLVSISKRGDVIPAVEKVIEKNEEGRKIWAMPKLCPSCKQELHLRGAHHFCVNVLCPDQVRGRIFFFIGSGGMDIDHFGPETAELLIKENIIIDISDIYFFNPDILLQFPGFKARKVENLKKGIEKSKGQPFQRVLPALGIPELGKSAAKLLIQAGFLHIDDLVKVSAAGKPEILTAIKGIGEKTAEIIIQELARPETLERIERLKKAGLNLGVSEKTQQGSSVADSDRQDTKSSQFRGQTWCVTGSFEHFKPRSLAEAEIEAGGGRVVSQVSGATTHLLAGANSGSKLEKARKVEARIIDEKTFLQLIAENRL